MVAIGGCLGYGIVQVLALPWFRHWVKVDSSSAAKSAAMLVDEERFADAKRIGFTLGGAAGIATAFDAPIGGILYMFEEATMTTWPPVLTFRAFVCTVCGCLISMGLFNLAGQDVHRLLIYMDAREYNGSWDWPDVPLFVLLAAIVGLLSAVFTRLLLVVWSCRFKRGKTLKKKWQALAKISECVLYAAVCSLAFSLMPLLVGCVQEPRKESEEFEYETIDHSLKSVRHACPEDQINEVATLLLKSTEGSLKHLFSRNTNTFHLTSLALTLGLYMTLNTGMAGLAVPMGNFIPSMLIGALVGRFMGETIAFSGYDVLADAGVYAMVGSAAMLGGFTHMTIAVVVILVEASRDLSLVSPLMLSIFISNIVSTRVNQHSYDEVLMLRKGVPFLEAELPCEMDSNGITAGDLCETVPDSALLPPEAAVETVQRALERWDVVHFPVIADGVCVGLTSRARLEAAMRARGAFRSRDDATSRILDDGSNQSDASRRFCELGGEGEEDLDIDSFIEALSSPTAGHSDLLDQSCIEGPGVSEGNLPVHRLMDSSPYMFLEDMPVRRLYPIFTRTCTAAACVVSRRGHFRGLLSRVNLISAASNAWRPVKVRMSRYEPIS